MKVFGEKGISAAVIKNIALLSMVIDHVIGIIYCQYLINTASDSYTTSIRFYANKWYFAGRLIGRLAFVLYAFMLAEGASRTRSRKKYAMNLLLLGIISTIPVSYTDAGVLFDRTELNIFFLLFLGLLTIMAYDWLKEKIAGPKLCILLQLLTIAGSCFLSQYFRMEYGLMGILLIMTFYIFRNDFRKMVFFGTIVITLGFFVSYVLSLEGIAGFTGQSGLAAFAFYKIRLQLFALLAFPLIYFYNGKKGNQLPKWFYYFFFPVHYGIIGLIVNLCM